MSSCGSDDPSSEGPAATADTGATTAAPDGTDAPDDTDAPDGTDAPADTTAAPAGSAGLIGYVVAGDRNDGGFYQGQVEAVEAAAAELGFDVIVVDKVNPGAAREAFENLARQGPDLIIGGGSELTDGLVPVSEAPEFADITYLMVSGAPPAAPTYATVSANESEAHYMGGVAMATVLQRNGGTTGCIVAGPELPFVQNMDLSMRAGMAAVDPSYEMLVTYTGSFEDAILAQEGVTAQINQGCEIVYPYLGGALVAVLDTAAEAGIGLVATSVDRCPDPSLPFSMSILYNPALYLQSAIESFSSGELVEGEQLALYGVGDGVGVGAVICDATDAEQAQLDAAAEQLASGEITTADWLNG
jgi:basic membrane protein A